MHTHDQDPMADPRFTEPITTIPKDTSVGGQGGGQFNEDGVLFLLFYLLSLGLYGICMSVFGN